MKRKIQNLFNGIKKKNLSEKNLKDILVKIVYLKMKNGLKNEFKK